MNNRTEKLDVLLHLSHQLGDPKRPLAILGEGNTSVRLDARSFLVKASGSNLAVLRAQGAVSYTHLDVYKRQASCRPREARSTGGRFASGL